MRAFGVISSLTLRTKTNEEKRQDQPSASPQYCTGIPAQGSPQDSTSDGRGQRYAIGQIRRPANAATGNGNRYSLAREGTKAVINSVGFRAIAKHLGKLLSAAATFFMAATTTAVLNFDHRLRSFDSANHAADSAFIGAHDYQRLSGAISSKGRSFAATASRARKIRERTVPIGQSMIFAISS